MSLRTEPTRLVALRLRLRGQVQGRGVRPAIARRAAELGLTGSVRNTRSGLEIVAEAGDAAMRRFRDDLVTILPQGCHLDSVDEEPIETINRCGFEILREEFDHSVAPEPLATPVPPDLRVCRHCLNEVGNRSNRRHQYPLTSCAVCGPRYSVIRSMPYERAETALAAFPLCISCRREYADPHDRRFHAQTTACRECGPTIWAVDSAGHCVGRDDLALNAVTAALRDGCIVALRGIGGYQLLCDAENEPAVRRLRSRKRRTAKPFAVLVRSIAMAQRLAYISAKERSVLSDASNPVVLLKPRNPTSLASSVHPGLDTLGLMLPTTPLHDQIAREFKRPLVCTSANWEGEPLEYEADASQSRLAGLADLWLHHNRPIERPIDDSVVRVIHGRAVTIRLGRGLAPLSLDLAASEPVLALGGHMKVAAAWNNGSQSVLGPHVGDMETAASRERLLAQCLDWERLYGFTPSRIVHDLHPDYFTTRRAAELRLPTIAVQHHFAHVAAGMLEHGLLNQTVLGVAWDGTGYGTDGTIWGGEFLVVEQARRFARVAHLRPFALPGGEAAILEPVRATIALLQEAIGREELLWKGIAGIDRARLEQILSMLQRPRLSVRTTSAGRLFDAAAALVLPIDAIDFDGQAAMLLEVIADHSAEGSYKLPLTSGSPMQLDWRPLFAALWEDHRSGRPPAVIAMRFHRALAEGIAAVVRRFPDLPAVLTGGVFQNRLLAELIMEALNGFPLLKLPGRIPLNDGGLAAGQLAVASQLEHCGISRQSFGRTSC